MTGMRLSPAEFLNTQVRHLIPLGDVLDVRETVDHTFYVFRLEILGYGGRWLAIGVKPLRQAAQGDPRALALVQQLFKREIGRIRTGAV